MEIDARPIPDARKPLIPAVDGVAELEVTPGANETYRDLRRHVLGTFTRASPWETLPWEVLVTGEEDAPLNRAMGFWRRHNATLAANEGALEASLAADGYISRSAANPIEDAERFLDALEAGRPTRVRSEGFLLPTTAGTERIQQVVNAALRAPSGRGSKFRFALVGIAVSAGCGLMVQDDTARGEPCLCFYGAKAVLDKIEAALRH